jgi:hypothetical protein
MRFCVAGALVTLGRCCDNTLKQATTTYSTSFPVLRYQVAYAVQATWVNELRIM